MPELAAKEGRPSPPIPFYLHPYFATVLVLAGVFASSWTLRRLEPAGPWRVAAALLAVPPSAFLIYTFVRWIRGLDELQRKIVGEAVAIAFCVSLVAMVGLEGLQKAGYNTAIRWEDGWEMMVFLYVAAYAYTNRRYK